MKYVILDSILENIQTEFYFFKIIIPLTKLPKLIWRWLEV